MRPHIPLFIPLFIGYILDLFFGDPRWMPHPVKFIGYLIKKLESLFRRFFKSNQKLAGLFFAFFIVFFVWLISFALIKKATEAGVIFGISVSSFLIYASLAIKDLKIESMEVVYALKKNNLSLAREKLSMIVGRDTNNLSEQEIIRATVETVAENTVDGIIAPLFYAFIGGAPLALAYKATNTLDSTVGYRNDRYRDFGWASARLDDLANFIPARISAVVLPIVSWLLGKDGLASLKIVFRDSRKNPSPNSGIPEAAVAGALGVQLGGLNFYNSKAILKPFIGDDINALESGHIKESIKISYISSALFLIIGVVLTQILLSLSQ